MRSVLVSEPERAARPRGLRRRAGRGAASRSGSLQVVLYHHLTDAPTELVDRLRVATPPALFEAHVERLTRDYEVVDLDQVLHGRLPKRALLITFDDGYCSVLDVAAPILERHGLPSVFFISAAHVTSASLPLDNLLCWLSHRVTPEELHEAVTGSRAAGATFSGVMAEVAGLEYGRRGRLGDELAERFAVDREALRRESGLFLDRSDLGRLSEFRMEPGNHTRSHVHCRSITGDDVADLELVDHRRRLEEWTGATVRSFSYPYGNRRDATRLVERVLAESGHEARFLVESRPNRRTSQSPLNRVSLGATPTSRLNVQLEILPRLRALKDRFR